MDAPFIDNSDQILDRESQILGQLDPLGAAALGLQRCKRWGYWTALAILCINLAGDTTNAVIAHDWRTLIGLPIGGAMVVYLLTKRSAFAP